jgi:glycosyltransferase involved in cell wall biosynthesis
MASQHTWMEVAVSVERPYEKKFSVIVPCYKVEKFLSRCLDSLLNQTFQDIEIVCVNDGSPDRCIDILNEYKERFPDKIVVIDKENEGVWRARWDGVSFARGEYIGFLDGDDYAEPNFAEVLYGNAKKHDADLSVCGFKRVDLDSGKALSREMCAPRSSFKISDDPGRLVELNGALWNKAFRASALKGMRDLDRPPLVLEDLLFHLLAYLQMTGKVVFSTEVCINYMVRSGSAMNSITQEHVDEASDAFVEVKSYYVEAGARPDMIEAIDTAAFLHLGVSMIFRLSYNKDIDLKTCISRTTKFLDDHFPLWRTSKYLEKSYVVSHGGSFKKLRLARKLYLAHLMPLFLGAYRFMIDTLKIDIKW